MLIIKDCFCLCVLCCVSVDIQYVIKLWLVYNKLEHFILIFDMSSLNVIFYGDCKFFFFSYVAMLSAGTSQDCIVHCLIAFHTNHVQSERLRQFDFEINFHLDATMTKVCFLTPCRRVFRNVRFAEMGSQM